MKKIVIIGAGGMGRTFYDIIKECYGFKETFIIKGFIDDNLNILDSFNNYPSLLGTIVDYIPLKDDWFVCSIGGTSRKECMEDIIERGGEFPTLVHVTSRIGQNVKLGVGNVIGAFTTIGADAVIGNYNLIQSYTVIGHDVKVGDWNRIDTHVTCVGGTRIENEAVIHTSAVINHGVTVENMAHVGACSFVIRKVKVGTTVIGNPAKRLL